MLSDDAPWSNNTDYTMSKLNSCLYCLKELKKFIVYICVLELFYKFVIKCVFTYSCVFCGGNITERDK